MEHKKRKYLNDIEVYMDESELCEGSARGQKFKEQQELYGFDERETWSLDITMRALLYERLMMYLEITDKVINLNYHVIGYREVEYTQRELIVKLINLLRDIIKKEEESFFYDELDSMLFYDLCSEVWEIWAVLERNMWW